MLVIYFSIRFQTSLPRGIVLAGLHPSYSCLLSSVLLRPSLPPSLPPFLPPSVQPYFYSFLLFLPTSIIQYKLSSPFSPHSSPLTVLCRSENSHPRLWRLLATAALEDLDLNMAERSFVRYHIHICTWRQKKLYCIRTRLETHTHMHMHMHTYMRTQTQTHTHRYIHTHPSIFLS